MKHFSLLLAFVSAAIAAPTPGWPKKTDQAGIPEFEAKKFVDANWPVGEKRDCIFWTGFDDGIPNDALTKIQGLVPGSVSWFSFFTIDQTNQWNWGLGDDNAGYSIGMTSAVYAKRCGEDGGSVYVMIPKDRSTDDPYPAGSKKPRQANWNLWEEPWITMGNDVEKIVRVDPSTMEDDIKNEANIIWKKGDGQKGIARTPGFNDGIFQEDDAA